MDLASITMAQLSSPKTMPTVLLHSVQSTVCLVSHLQCPNPADMAYHHHGLTLLTSHRPAASTACLDHRFNSLAQLLQLIFTGTTRLRLPHGHSPFTTCVRLSLGHHRSLFLQLVLNFSTTVMPRRSYSSSHHSRWRPNSSPASCLPASARTNPVHGAPSPSRSRYSIGLQPHCLTIAHCTQVPTASQTHPCHSRSRPTPRPCSATILTVTERSRSTPPCMPSSLCIIATPLTMHHYHCCRITTSSLQLTPRPCVPSPALSTSFDVTHLRLDCTHPSQLDFAIVPSRDSSTLTMSKYGHGKTFPPRIVADLLPAGHNHLDASLPLSPH